MVKFFIGQVLKKLALPFNHKTQKFKTFQNFQNQKINKFTTVAFRPNSTQLLVGSAHLGILVFDTEQKKFIQQFTQNFTNSKSIAQDWVEDIVIDKQQNLFVNVMGTGIDFTNINASNTEHWFDKEAVKKSKLVSNWVANSWIHKNKILVKFNVENPESPIFILDTHGKILNQI